MFCVVKHETVNVERLRLRLCVHNKKRNMGQLRLESGTGKFCSCFLAPCSVSNESELWLGFRY